MRAFLRHVGVNDALRILEVSCAPLRLYDWQGLSSSLRASGAALSELSLAGSRLGDAGLAANLHDEAYVSNHATNAAFLDDMVAYPGGVVADFIDYLWIDNVLGEGHLPMADPPADLADVQAPILNISGRGDPIVTPSCSQAMTRFVASDDVTSIHVSFSS